MTKTIAPVLNEANRKRILSLYQIADHDKSVGIFWRSGTLGVPRRDRSVWFSGEVYMRFTYRSILRYRVIRRFQGKSVDGVRQKVVALHSQAQTYLIELVRQWPGTQPIPAAMEV